MPIFINGYIKPLAMNKFINPFSDYGWKKIFGSEVSKDLIISFLNEVIQQEVIVDITFRNVEMLGLKQDQRRAVFDIFARMKAEKFSLSKCKKAVRNTSPTEYCIMHPLLSSNNP